ncbi:MAG TPA: gephyrin-like molybdotransferase Glp [Kineosporiaceae bacterium]|nr:gephyrin-like molybdotransferase Glp [Kineosporiaceae bacterium]
MITVEEHRGRALAAFAPLPPVRVPLLRALGLVLAEDVVSSLVLPPFENSAMDGFAVRAADVAAASDADPVVLPVLGEVAAGGGRPAALEPGTAVRIMTGAPVPPGADAVVPVEWTAGWTDGERVVVHRAAEPGAFVRAAGGDVESGEVVLRAGARLSPRHLALLAAVGCADVAVRPAPRVVVLSTGSELVPLGQDPRYGEIHDSNGYGLTAAAAELGADASYAGIVADEPGAVRAALEAAAASADLVLTSGGVSAGTRDTVKEVLTALGTVRFDKVAMQPGMPQGFGTIGGTPVFTLPGNPVSSMVSFEVFVRPALLAVLGVEGWQRPRVEAAATVGWSAPAGRRQYARATLDRHDGQVTVTPVGAQGSHLAADLAVATCLAVVPEDVTRVEPGDELECDLLTSGPVPRSAS